MDAKSSRLPGFYKRSLSERIQIVADWAALSPEQSAALHSAGLSAAQADHMIENAIGVYALPLGIAANFQVNGRDVLVPLASEEPSGLAAVSNAARLFRAGGGFSTRSDEPVMIGQIQVLDVPDPERAQAAILAERDALLAEVDRIGGSIVRMGGGARDVLVRRLPDTGVGPMLVVHLLYDARDAMGANAINTAVEHIAPRIEALSRGRVGLRILSNLTDRRKAYAEGRIPAAELATDSSDGSAVARAIVEAGAFAEADPYRAATHNKGVMNGIDALIIATGNDWRAVEAGAHAYASRDGRYTSLTHWWQNETGDLHGRIELPLAVGSVGGATRVHPTAQAAMRILNVSSARELSEIAAAVGLAQNLAAIRALATEGIQRGHMRMHARQIAIAAGAAPQQVTQVVEQMITENNIRPERARAIVEHIKGQG